MVARDIRLVISDVDGTLVTSDKTLTTRAIGAVQQLREADIMFAIASARPAQGILRFLEPLALTTPLNALNGGLGVDAAMSLLYSHVIDPVVAHSVIDSLLQQLLTVWVYQGTNWYVLDEFGPHVQHESGTSNLGPSVISSFDQVGDGIIKIVGVSDDVARSQHAHQSISPVSESIRVRSFSFFPNITNWHPIRL
jgi:hydroxymethylpyrimidine pyrophosphatase-like HAD family hydrolase